MVSIPSMDGRSLAVVPPQVGRAHPGHPGDRLCGAGPGQAPLLEHVRHLLCPFDNRRLKNPPPSRNGPRAPTTRPQSQRKRKFIFIPAPLPVVQPNTVTDYSGIDAGSPERTGATRPVAGTSPTAKRPEPMGPARPLHRRPPTPGRGNHRTTGSQAPKIGGRAPGEPEPGRLAATFPHPVRHPTAIFPDKRAPGCQRPPTKTTPLSTQLVA